MIFNDRTYSVLIVSSSEKFNTSLSPFLKKFYCHQVRKVNSISLAKREVYERHFDIIIINAPLSDDFGTNFAVDISAVKDTVCLMFVKTELYDDITWKYFDRGVYTISKPSSLHQINQAMTHMITTLEKLRILDSKSISLEDKMEEIKMVNRAKWMLIVHMKMSESDAHHYIEKQAMNTCSTRREIASQIIKKYS